MLVLTRRRNQSIVIGDSVVVTVLAVDGERVKLGIEAPESIPVLRQEVLRAVGGENRIAARLPAQRDAFLRALRTVWPSTDQTIAANAASDCQTEDRSTP